MVIGGRSLNNESIFVIGVVSVVIWDWTGAVVVVTIGVILFGISFCWIIGSVVVVVVTGNVSV